MIDFGLEVLAENVERTDFPWLMSNVIDKETGLPLGNGKIFHIITHNNIKIGLIGLIEEEWMDTLGVIDVSELVYTDFVQAGNELAAKLRRKGCEIVIALTHMRNRNDFKLAENANGIDLILGGHDHISEDMIIKGIHTIKSGTDFRQFSLIQIESERDANGKLKVNFKAINITSGIEENEEITKISEAYSLSKDKSLNKVLGTFTVNLDGRFVKIRTSETNLGNWVCDAVLSATGVDLVILNSGSFRSDKIHLAGPFKLKDLLTIFPQPLPLVTLEVNGQIILEALENGVSAYPRMEGRFPQTSGIKFNFDANARPMKRILSESILVGEHPLDMRQKYRICVGEYIRSGHDGYVMFKNAKIMVSLIS